MKSDEYWSKRMEALNEAELKKGEDYIRQQQVEYEKSLNRIKKETESWYARLAKNNDVSMAEARKLLTSNELKEFHWDVEEYIERGRENAVDQRWMKELENASAKVHITRLEEIELKTRQELELLATRRVKGATDVLGNIYQDGYYKGIYEVQRGLGQGLPFAKLDVRQIDKVLAKPWAPDGRNFSARIWGDRDKLVAELQTALTQDLIRGGDVEKVIADFSQRMNVSRHAAERLIRTEAAYFSGQSRLDGYKETDVKYYKYVATMDARTSDQCRDMEGKIIPLSEAKAGVNYPPLHAYCRSTTIPHFDEPEEEIDQEEAYKVPEESSFQEWAEEHAPKDADEPIKVDDPAPAEPSSVKRTGPDEQIITEELTLDEEAALIRYSSDESVKINEKLHKEIPLDGQEMVLVEQLDKAISKLPRYQGDLSRSLHFKSSAAVEQYMKDIKPGAVLQYPQYVSTTVGGIYNHAAQIHFYVLGAVLGADMKEMSLEELEVLYGRDFPFEVMEIEIIDGVYHILLREMMQ